VLYPAQLRVDNDFPCYGFPWYKNSCLPNSCMTIELHIFKFLLIDSAQLGYCIDLPLLGKAFRNINYFDVDLSWQYQNYTVLTQLWDQT